ncbi:MAG: DEAD/DEAH box helicase [Austwickia sp.]|nr:MAG: DEAD/DEAH box helicase [Austwickia sp.]
MTSAGAAGFDDLDPVLQHHVVNTLGWRELRALQQHSIAPILSGHDVLLLAPTAGGKTEAALFPLLTRASREGWRGTSILYICPLKALLNNIHVRAQAYAGWLGRRAELRHGDIGAGARRRQVIEPPDLLLTTPESIEAMLVSALNDPRDLFRDVRAVVVDEVHAFAGDDRGWHLLAVLERVARIAGRPLQRIGCSATVGNAPELLSWLQGSNRAAGVPAAVINPPPAAAAQPEVVLDYVGGIPNAAEVASRLYVGEKRLLFADSRRAVERLAVELRERGVDTYVSHSSLSLDERRRAEAAFAQARDCLIVSTSTLELGIDVGDLDRVLQLGAPSTVASFLQRLGRTGRRPGGVRNTLFLAPDDDALLRAAGLLLLWSEGYVEPTIPPPIPLHIVAQQVIAQALERSAVTGSEAWEPLAPLGVATPAEFDKILAHLHASGHLDTDGGLSFVGPEAERRYGRKHFLDLLAVFSAPPEVTILHGRDELGTVEPVTLTRRQDGPTVLSLAGRSWRVTGIDWPRRRAYVEPSDAPGRTTWGGGGAAYTPQLCDAMRRVLAGADPDGVALTRRARQRLDHLRELRGEQAWSADPVVLTDGTATTWWTWAGLRGNVHRAAALDAIDPTLLAEGRGVTNLAVRLRPGCQAAEVAEAMREAHSRFGADLAGVQITVSEEALRGLKFAELLPEAMARRVLAAR